MTKLFDWLVIKPNAYYDSLKEPFRLLVFIIPVILLNSFFAYIDYHNIFVIFCVFVSLWRSLYLFKK